MRHKAFELYAKAIPYNIMHQIAEEVNIYIKFYNMGNKKAVRPGLLQKSLVI